MNLVVDENIDRGIVDRLRLDGHQIEWIAEACPSVSDIAVAWFRSQRDGRGEASAPPVFAEYFQNRDV